MKQSQESEPDPKLEKMIERSREIGREIEAQAQRMDKSLVTDRPNLTGYLDGAKAVREDTRSSRVNQTPEAQRNDYMDGFRRGVKP